MSEKENKDVETMEPTNLAFMQGSNVSGFEGTNADTFKTPFIKILQALSPELNKSKPEYIADAEIGQFCNTATKQLYDNIDVVVLKIEHNLLVWKPNRGGFVGSYPKSKEQEIVFSTKGAKKYDEIGNDVNDTISFYLQNIDDPSDIFILSMATASLKYAKSFSTRLRMLKANGKPVDCSFAGIWSITTVDDHNEHGDWKTVGDTPTFKRFITETEYNEVITPALKLLETAQTDYSQTEEKSADTSEQNIAY